MNSAQEIFDKVVIALRKQGKKSMDNTMQDGNICRYRDYRGNKCAIGHLLSDEEYRPSMEGNSVRSLISFRLVSDATIEWMKPHLDLLIALQAIHDSVGGPQMWENKWEKLAKKNGLTVPS